MFEELNGELCNKMFWKKKKIEAEKPKINSEEYLELLEKYNKLKVQVASLEIDLQLYVKKLKLSKGIAKDEEKENSINPVILPM